MCQILQPKTAAGPDVSVRNSTLLSSAEAATANLPMYHSHSPLQYYVPILNSILFQISAELLLYYAAGSIIQRGCSTVHLPQEIK